MTSDAQSLIPVDNDENSTYTFITSVIATSLSVFETKEMPTGKYCQTLIADPEIDDIRVSKKYSSNRRK